MKIGIDARALTAQRTGMGRYITNLLEYFAERQDKNSYVLFGQEDIVNLPSLIVGKFQKVTLKTASLPGKRTIYEQILLPLAASRHKVDVLFCPAYTAPLFCKTKIVTTIHDEIYMRQDNELPPEDVLYYKLFSKHAAKKSSKLLTISVAAKHEILKYYNIGSNKIEAVLLAPDPIFKPIKNERILKSIKDKYKLGEKYILYVGQILTRRQVPTLLNAFAQVLKTNPELKLVIVGKNRTYPKIAISNLINKLKIQEQVIWLEYVNDEELVLLYNSANIFIYISTREGFGFPVLEAMSCGCPVITSNVSSLAEISGDAALQVTPGDIGELTDAITTLLNDEELSLNYIEKGFAQSAMFTWEKTSDHTLKIIESIIN